MLRWGAVGNWYSGGWYDSGALQYIGQVQQILHNQPWTTARILIRSADHARRFCSASRNAGTILLPIRNQPDIGALENLRLRIVVDRDHRLRALDADCVIDRAANTDREI